MNVLRIKNGDVTNIVEVKHSELAWKDYQIKATAVRAVKMDDLFGVLTNAGTVFGHKGDYLVKNIEGEYYPCAQDVFEESYEESEHETVTNSSETA
jgi:hypothetical protein